MKNKWRVSAQVTLALVYLVILAGAVVRMTGSGMGCPDWPKCFGYLIPPTEANQLEWQPQHRYHKGEVIIVSESLRVAKKDFTSSVAYEPERWAPYTKHDYAAFNVYHTWIEFINRLLGALAGLATLFMAAFSVIFWRTQKSIPLLSFAVLLGIGFQAWLGKTVVDSNLLPMKITIHMAMAFVLVLLLVTLLHLSRKPFNPITTKPIFKIAAIAAVLLTLVQIGMGTQVRQFVDIQMHPADGMQTNSWLANAPLIFYIHRSFSILVLLVHGYLGYQLVKMKNMPRIFFSIAGLLLLEIGTGIVMYYLDFPFSSQPLHLIIASLLFGAQTYFLLEITAKQQTHDL